MNKSYLLLPLTLFVVSCATTTKVEEPKINYLDISGKNQIKLVDEYWTVAKRIEPRYPISAAKNNISGCVDLIVGIDQNGKAQEYKVRSSYPKGVFDKNAVAAMVKWKWQATEKNIDNSPVLTSIRMDFSTSRNPSDPEYLQNCPKREI
ncbi:MULTISPECIES: energy transducer TonB [unclassified Pseudoalteromonas]|uniref:energy transducer TonB n=1 Tax=Pseudoalteromonas TaxID=53246 RepID=UPI000462F693|nr:MULTISPECIES: energy transducer TonB [unclassified Pseudoalteromonas]